VNAKSVKLSAKTEYACIAVLELARRFEAGEPVRIRDIADEHGIPSRFLVQILLQLKGAGYVTSTRGAAGGYQLLKPPGKITLGEVMSVIEGNENGQAPAAARSPTAVVLSRTWRDIAAREQEMLRAITFADLAEKAEETADQMYYI
jgi:Rrf2 family protein